MHEILQQCRHALEPVRLCGAVQMAMVALAALVVVAHDTLAIAHEDEPVLETVLAWRHWTRHRPDHDLDEPARVSIARLTDSKTTLGKSGSCDPSMVMPSEAWASAVQVPAWAVKRQSPWRLASPQELDSIAAKSCGDLTNPKYIEIMFEQVWTRSTASGDKVWLYGTDRVRKESPKQSSKPNEFFAQTIYVRNAP